MRLSTIWSIHSMSLVERFRRTGDWAAMKFASKLPRRVRYWVTMLELGKATRTSPNIPATPLEDILQNLEGGPK